MNTAAEEIPLHEQVRSFVGASRKMLIGGRWLDATLGKNIFHLQPRHRRGPHSGGRRRS